MAESWEDGLDEVPAAPTTPPAAATTAPSDSGDWTAGLDAQVTESPSLKTSDYFPTLEAPELQPLLMSPRDIAHEEQSKQAAAWKVFRGVIESTGIPAMFEVAQGAKEKYVDPVLRLAQARNRMDYEMSGLGPTLREKSPAAAFLAENLGQLALGPSALAPEKPEVAEGSPLVAKAVTSWEEGLKTYGRISPEYLLGGEDRDQKLQEAATKATAFIQGLSQEAGKLGLYLIPGVGSQEAGATFGIRTAGRLAEGATGGFFSELATPGGNLAAGTIGGAAAGPALGGLFEAAGRGLAKMSSNPAKLRKSWEVLGMLPPQSEEQAVKAVFYDTPAPVIPTKDAPKNAAFVAVDVTPEGEIAAKFAAIESDGKLTAQDIAPQKGNLDVTKVDSPRPSNPDATVPGKRALGQPVELPKALAPKEAPKAKEVLPEVMALKRAQENGLTTLLSVEARAAARNSPSLNWVTGVDELGAYRVASSSQPTEDILPKLIDTMGDPEWRELNPARFEGGVLVADETGLAKLVDIKNQRLQIESLRTRGLARVQLPDGTTAHGYVRQITAGDLGGRVAPEDAGKEFWYIYPADADEGIPRNLKEAIMLPKQDPSVRILDGDNELKKVIEERNSILADIEDQAQSAYDVRMGTSEGGAPPLDPPPPQSPPPPPPGPGPGNVPPTLGAQLGWLQALRNGGDWLSRKFINATSRGSETLAQAAAIAHSLDSFESLKGSAYKSLQEAIPELQRLPAAKVHAVQADIGKQVMGKMSLDELTARHPELSAKVYERLRLEQADAQADVAKLSKLGILGAAPTPLTGDLEQLSGLFLRDLMPPGEWAAKVKRDKGFHNSLIASAMDAIYSKGKFSQLPKEAQLAWAERHVNEVIGDDAARRASEKFGGLGYVRTFEQTAAGKSVMPSRDYAPWERLAMGEVEDGLIVLAAKKAQRKQLIAHGEMWQSLVQAGTVVPQESLTPQQIAAGWKPLPMEASYGFAAGHYVSPNDYEDLITIPNQQYNFDNMIGTAINAMKYGQTVLNPGSWGANFFGNAQGMALTGLVNPFAYPTKVAAGMSDFVDDVKAFKKLPGIAGHITNDLDGIRRDRLSEAMKRGIVGSNFSTDEFNAGAQAWSRILDSVTGLNGKRSMIDVFKVGFKRTAQDVAQLYGVADDIWKYAAWSSGLEAAGINRVTGEVDVKAVLQFLPDGWTAAHGPAALRKAAMDYVSLKIHRGMPMLDRTGQAISRTAPAQGTVINPYIKITTELTRNYAMLPFRMAKEKGFAARMVAYGGVLAASYGTFLGYKQLAGIDAETEQRAYASAPESVQQFKVPSLACFARDEKGRLTCLDMGFMATPLTWVAGDPSQAPVANMLTNMLLAPISGTPTEAVAGDMLQVFGLQSPRLDVGKLPEWKQTGAMQLGRLMAKYGPGGIRNTYNTLERGGFGFTPRNTLGQPIPPQSPGVTGFNLLAGPNRAVQIGGEEAERAAQISAKIKAAETRNNLRSLVRNTKEGQSTGPLSAPLNKQEAVQRQREALLKQQQKLTETHKLFAPRKLQ